MTRPPLPLRVLRSLLRHLVLPWCVATLFLALVCVASWVLGVAIMALLTPVYWSGGGIATGLTGMSLGWVALWAIFLIKLAIRRGHPASGADNTTMDASHPVDENQE